MSLRNKVAVGLLTLSAAGFATWVKHEGFTDHAVIPTKGDVPTIGHGSTRWEDGTPVSMDDTITPARADVLARALNSQAEKDFAKSLPGVALSQDEFDLYMDFIGQYGITNWRKSSMRRELLAGNYLKACDSLLQWKRAAGYDCSTPGNKRCSGVWTRQLERHSKCLAAQ